MTTPLNRRKKLSSYAVRLHIGNLLFLLPTIILFGVVVLIPFIQGIPYSFTSWKSILSTNHPYNGLTNYKYLLGNKFFKQSLGVTFHFTLEYLLQFEELLSSRAAQKRFQSRGEFYSMYNVGQYTFSDWKCVWRRMDSQISAAAIGPRSVGGLPPRPVFPQETCVFIPAQSEAEEWPCR